MDYKIQASVFFQNLLYIKNWFGEDNVIDVEES